MILAEQILALIARSGATGMEAQAALAITSQVLPTIPEMTFRNDLPEPADAPR